VSVHHRSTEASSSRQPPDRPTSPTQRIRSMSTPSNSAVTRQDPRCVQRAYQWQEASARVGEARNQTGGIRGRVIGSGESGSRCTQRDHYIARPDAQRQGRTHVVASTGSDQHSCISTETKMRDAPTHRVHRQLRVVRLLPGVRHHGPSASSADPAGRSPRRATSSPCRWHPRDRWPLPRGESASSQVT
jgi:hypothetical protein